MVLFSNVYVGQRIEVYWGRGIFRGIIQYKGCLATRRGDWVGVALDKPVGEHNGMLYGRRYFQCRDQHGVFVRADKIRFIPSVRCLYDRYHKVAPTSYVEEPLFSTKPPEVKNGPYDPITLSPNEFKRVHSSIGEYSSSVWSKPPQHHLRHSVSNTIPAATMLLPATATSSFRYHSFPIHMQYRIDDDFICSPSIPKIHMPHSALLKQVRRGWNGSHYVREMSVPTGRDAMKFGQWNDVSP